MSFILIDKSKKMTTNRHQEYQYLDLMKHILENWYRQEDMWTDAVTYSVFWGQMRYNLSEWFPLLTTKRVYWKWVLHELYWFLSGQTNIKYLVDNNVHIWDDYPYKIYKAKMAKWLVTEYTKEEFVQKIAESNEFALEHWDLKRCYGEMWRRWPTRTWRTIDQLQWIIDEIKMDPNCHNAIVNSRNPEYLYTMATPEDASRFPICHNMYQCGVNNGKLSLHLYQRSADLFLWVPFNIGSYALLTHILAKITWYEAWDFVHTFWDVHIYRNHFDQAKEQLAREPKAFPQIKFTQDFKTLEEFRPEFVELVWYEPHGTIKAELSVTWGYKWDIITDTQSS